MNVLLEVGGKREKGKASRHLMPQSAVVNGISTIKTRHSILNGKKKLMQIAYLIITSFSLQMLPNYVIKMISNT